MMNTRGWTTLLLGTATWIALAAGPATADFVPIAAPTHSGELGHPAILEAAFSPGTAWEPFGDRRDARDAYVDFTNGTLSAIRVDDFGLNGILDAFWNSPGDATDAVWTGQAVSAEARARYAAYAQEFGYDLLGDNAGYAKLFDVSGSGTNVSGGATLSFARNDAWTWARSGSGLTWYSDIGGNTDGDDHLVTYELTGLDDGLKHWLLCWEDLPDLGDADYNDLVVEVTAVPEPEVVMLAGAGGVALLFTWRRRQ
ncbi:MAG: DUF4114 domain-containing protein [Phycisphaerae bacterium]|jgi:hypothetical protein